jgi:TPR repeat protein
MNNYAPECPICLLDENEKQLNDDNFICFVCGIICCDSCSKHIDKCPLCRATLRLSLTERINHFENLLKRDNYNYLYFAQYRIGSSFLFLKRYAESLYWMESSAMMGFSLAQYMMGYIFLKGIGIPKNIELSFEWFKLSDKNHFLNAKTVIAYFYLKGLHVEKNLAEAKNYFLNASVRGDILAQNNLGNIYNDQCRTKEAYKWYKEASKQGCSRSKYMTAIYLENGWGMWSKHRNKAYKIYKELSAELVKFPLPIKDTKIEIIREIIISDNVMYF